MIKEKRFLENATLIAGRRVMMLQTILDKCKTKLTPSLRQQVEKYIATLPNESFISPEEQRNKVFKQKLDIFELNNTYLQIITEFGLK